MIQEDCRNILCCQFKVFARTRIKYNSLLVSLLTLKIWDFLTMWWSNITKFFAFLLPFKIISFQVFGKASIILFLVCFVSIFKKKFCFYILPSLYISIIIKKLTSKVQVFVRKKRKMHRLTFNLNIWVKTNELRQEHGWKSWFCSLVNYPFYENILTKRWKFWKNVIVFINIIMKLEILT